MNRVKIILFFWLAFATQHLFASGPVLTKPVRKDVHPGVQFLNHKDWNFVENKGQLPPGPLKGETIKYYGHQRGVYLYCKPGMISFVFTKAETKETDKISEATSLPVSNVGVQNPEPLHLKRADKTTVNRADLILLNSNPAAQIIATAQQEYYENFYTTGDADHGPSCSRAGITNVHTYKTITYKSIYPNIDLVLHTKPNGMKYEFVVYPGGKVSDIQMQWNGLEGIKKLKDSLSAQAGKIEYSCALGGMSEEKPVSFQGDNIVASDFDLQSNVVGFKVDRYDKAKILVIDPTLDWGTYLGGSGDDVGNCVATDTAGNVYITGNTTSTSGIATKGAFQTIYGGGFYSQAFLAKFNSSGVRQWATYYGGNGSNAVAYGIWLAVDNAGNVYSTGGAYGFSGIATAGAYQTSLAYVGTYDGDAFLVKFNSGGLRQWGTYYGIGTGSGVATYANGNIYLTGTTASPSGLSATYNAFLAKFNSGGVRQWGTYFGKGDEQGNGIAIDFSGNLYITGTTSSTNGIATSGAFKTSISGGSDAFLAKFSISGSLAWATYYGGNGSDLVQGVSTDASGNVYITGYTASNSGLATSGAYQTAYSGATDGFLAKFSSVGTELWSTYFGGNSMVSAHGVSADAFGNIYIAGYTTSSNGVATSGAYQISYGGGGRDGFLAKFSSSGSLAWATYYGSNGFDAAFGVTTDERGNVYITGETNSTSNIATSGSFQTIFGGGGYDAFIAKFGVKNKSDIGIDSIISPTAISCKDSFSIVVQLKNFGSDTLKSATISSSVNGRPQIFYSWTGSLYPDSTININIGTDTFPSGTDTLKVWSEYPNGGNDSVPSNDTSTTVIRVYSLPIPNAGPDTTLCYNETYTMQGSGGITYTWHPATYLSSATDPNAIAILPNTEHYELIVQNSYGCIDSAPVLLQVRPRLKVKAHVLNNPVCYGQNVTIYATSSGGDSLHYTYQWVNDSATGDSITEKGIQSGWHKVILKDNCTPDSVTDSIYVTVIPPAKADFTFGQAQKIKINQKIDFLNQSTNASSYLWTFTTKDTSKLVSPVYIYTDSGEYKIELIAYGIDGCPNDTAYKVIKIIGNQVTIYIPDAFSPNGDGINDFFDISGIGILSYSYNIYNRWGEHLFASPRPSPSGEGEGWDGTFKGQPVIEGVYIYQLDVIDIDGQHHYLSGNIMLMR